MNNTLNYKFHFITFKNMSLHSPYTSGYYFFTWITDELFDFIMWKLTS